jgi:hypothetical protein
MMILYVLIYRVRSSAGAKSSWQEKSISKNGRRIWSKATVLGGCQHRMDVMPIFSYSQKCGKILPLLTDFYIKMKLLKKFIDFYTTMGDGTF